MKHAVTVSINEDGNKTKVVTAKEQTMREKILTHLFGKKAKVLVITPYSATNEITIKEQGGMVNGHQRGLHFDCS